MKLLERQVSAVDPIALASVAQILLQLGIDHGGHALLRLPWGCSSIGEHTVGVIGQRRVLVEVARGVCGVEGAIDTPTEPHRGLQ